MKKQNDYLTLFNMTKAYANHKGYEITIYKSNGFKTRHDKHPKKPRNVIERLDNYAESYFTFAMWPMYLSRPRTSHTTAITETTTFVTWSERYKALQSFAKLVKYIQPCPLPLPKLKRGRPRKALK